MGILSFVDKPHNQKVIDPLAVHHIMELGGGEAHLGWFQKPRKLQAPILSIDYAWYHIQLKFNFYILGTTSI